jgi:hypothetical protein
VAEWLLTYHLHKFNPKRRMKTSKKNPFFGLRRFGWWRQIFLTRGVIAADIYVEHMALNENTRLLLGAAIANFSNRRLFWTQNTPCYGEDAESHDECYRND